MQLFIRLLNQKLGIIILQIIIFLSLFTIIKPSLSGVNCGLYAKTEIINPNGSKYQSCVLSTKFNKHGSIHDIGTSRYNTFRIYQGKSGDAILESSLKRYYGSWRYADNLIIFQFPSGMKIYIPVEY